MSNKPSDQSKTIYSFDVFDTCISRTYEHPTDLFFHLGYKISPTEWDEKSRITFASKFRENRISAEKVANGKMGKHRNSDLDSIYKLILLPEFCTHSAKEIQEIEIEMEIDCSYAIKKTIKEIEDLRKLKYEIIYISDMYLPKEVIFRLLEKNNVIYPNEKLFVSSEFVDTKHSGKLFRHVLEILDKKNNFIIHHGDNYHSDVRMAIKNGLQGIHIKNTTIFEKEKTFDYSRVDFSKSILNSIPKFLRLNQFSSLPMPELLYFGIVTPTIISFTVWTLAKAKDLGLKRLYFVSRDAELPFKIAQKIAPNFDIDVKYLLGSRRAWLLPSIENADSWKGIATPVNVTSSVIDALERLQFSQPEIEYIIGKFNISEKESTEKNSNENIEKIIIMIMEDAEVSIIFKNKIESQREICTQYFRDCGLFSDTNWAIVDSGWSLNTQGCLKRILTLSGYQKEVIGFYFGTAPSRFIKNNAGIFHSFTENDSIYFYRAAAIEHCLFPSTQNSLSHYAIHNNTIETVFMENGQSEFDISFSNNLHKYVLDYTDKMINLHIDPIIFLENRIEIIEKFRDFLTNPDTIIAKHLSQLSISIDARHSKKHREYFFKKISLSSFLRILFSYITNLKKECFFWPEASANISYPAIKHIMIFLLRLKNRKTNK